MLGLVLEGGGARGSFQIGACKALRECGFEISGVTGTSIGALNGAMIAQGDLDKVYDIWYNISPAQVFDIEDNRLEELKNFEVTQDGFLYFMKKAKEIAQSKGLDITFIRKLLREHIDEARLRNSKVDFGFVTVSLSDMRPMELFLEDIPVGKLTEYLLASANLPAFKQEKIDGKYFVDGAFHDNLPYNMLVSKGYRDLIAIRTKSIGRVKKLANPDVQVRYISSEENLGGILDFGQNQARYNLQLGYYDFLRSYQGLKGKKYYLLPTGDEAYFMNFLLAPGEQAVLRLGEELGFKDIPYRRLLFEHLLPKLSSLLGLSKESSYEEMVIAILEVVALEGQIERFKVYTFPEFFNLIREVVRSGLEVANQTVIAVPTFVKQSDVLSRAVKDRLAREMIQGLLTPLL